MMPNNWMTNKRWKRVSKKIQDVMEPKSGVKFVFFSGKGGVGKTTMAAATALWLADKGHKILILSTDLQKSLNDILEQETVGKETEVTGVPNLRAMTVETSESLARHQDKMMKTIELIDPNSTIVKQYRHDLKSAGDCGCSKAAYYEFIDYLNKEEEYDVIVFDTAPTGQTLEQVRSPIEYVQMLIGQIENRKRLTEVLGQKEVEQQIKGLEEMKQQEEHAIENLRSVKTSFNMVMIPEAMPLAELERNIPVLENDYKIPIRGIVINEVIPEKERSVDAFWRNRWTMQKKYIGIARRKFPDKAIAESPLLETEVLGVERIRRITHALYGGEKT
jgi:arsenite/tail-anchored protein-transporting ATPase